MPLSIPENSIFIGAKTHDTKTQLSFDLKYANRHGLIAGATGTGKTVTLQIKNRIKSHQSKKQKAYRLRIFCFVYFWLHKSFLFVVNFAKISLLSARQLKVRRTIAFEDILSTFNLQKYVC